MFCKADEPAPAMDTAVPGDDNSDFHKLETQLIQASEAADTISHDDELDVPPIPQPAIPQPADLQLPKKIPLKSLFDYSTPLGYGLDIYWKGRLKNLELELTAHDLLYEEEDDNLLAGSVEEQASVVGVPMDNGAS
jgi:hypothetical protein